MTKAILWMILLAAVSLGQSPRVPELGWIAGEEPGRFQRVTGLAGAAQLDTEVDLGPSRLLALRPGSPVAIAVSEEGGVYLVNLEAADRARSAVLEGALAAPAVVAWSPSGDALLLAGDGWIQVWVSNADGVPHLLREFPFEAEAAAVSDGGARVLARAEGALYQLDEDGAIEPVSGGPAGAFTFLAGSPQFAWIEHSALRFGGGAPPEGLELGELPEGGRRLLAGAAPGKLLLAEPGAEETRLRVWNMEGAVEGDWRIPAEVTELHATGALGVVRLAARGAGPVWMADLTAVQPSVFFVPRGERQARQGGEK
ncbi:MAG: hypothetical protein ACUVS7_10720 [Bryobacteraceae bacterium]